MNVIDQILARLDNGRLWKKRGYGHWNRDDTMVCLLGATYSVYGYSNLCHVPSEIKQVIAEQFPDRIPLSGVVSYAYFNDHKATTWADVQMALEKASILYEEKR